MIMAVVIAAYTICNISDKYIVSKQKIHRNEYTFFLSLSSLFFLTFFLPFTNCTMELNMKSIGIIGGAALCKLIEFSTLAAVLKELTPFEVKAWLGICIFLSYFTDIMLGTESFELFKFFMIVVSVLGLFLIVWDNHRSINYKKIALFLALHIVSKYAYGLDIKQAAKIMSTTMTLYLSLIIVTLVMLPKVHPLITYREKKKGIKILCGARFVNVIGNIAENEVIKTSLVQYSFIQPGILILLFIDRLFHREHYEVKNIIGSILCISGIISFSIYHK